MLIKKTEQNIIVKIWLAGQNIEDQFYIEKFFKVADIGAYNIRIGSKINALD